MNSRPRVLLLVVLASVVAPCWPPSVRGADRVPSGREDAYRFNNLGVALMEQFRFADAAEQFKKALVAEPKLPMAKINLALALFYVPDVPAARKEAEEAAALAPAAPQPRYLLALIARMDNRGDDAIASLKPVLEADPKDLGANLVLGQVYLQQRKFEEAVAVFRTAAAAEPYNVSAAYNLGVALTRGGQREEGAAQMAHFQELRESAYKTSFGQTYMEQGRYAETVSSTGAEAELVDPKTPPVTFTEAAGMAPAVVAAAAPPALLGRSLEPAEVPAAIRAGGRAALTLVDLDGDGALDAIDVRGGALRVLRNAGGRLTDATPDSGLAGVEGRAVVAGDYDNDGKPDLLVLKPGGLALFHNEGGGRFKDVTVAAQLPPYPHIALVRGLRGHRPRRRPRRVRGRPRGPRGHRGAGRPLAFPTGFAPAPSLLLRNNGDGTFTDITARARSGRPATPSRSCRPTSTTAATSTSSCSATTPRRPFSRTCATARSRTWRRSVGLAARGPFLSAAAADVNKDGFTDFFLGTASGPSLLALSDGRGGFSLPPAPDGRRARCAAQLVDYDDDGLLDLAGRDPAGVPLLRNLGADVRRRDARRRWRHGLRGPALGGAALADRRPRRRRRRGRARATTAGGAPLPARTRAATRNRSFPVRLAGRVSNRDGVGAKVEMRAGSLRQKLETSATAPAGRPGRRRVRPRRARTRPTRCACSGPPGSCRRETESRRRPAARARAPPST